MTVPTPTVLVHPVDGWRVLAAPHSIGAAVAVAAGTAMLLARPWLLPGGTNVRARVALFVALGVVGVAWRMGVEGPRPPAGTTGSVAIPALGLGVLAFALAWALAGPRPRASALGLALALNALAAVAEEAFFRRLAYGWLLRWGTATAVVGSAGLFAVAHVTVWGFGVLPLDLAAGLLLSWQRAATGRWSIPAATHVVANTLALL